VFEDFHTWDDSRTIPGREAMAIAIAKKAPHPKVGGF
jgi:hypothetical protein